MEDAVLSQRLDDNLLPEHLSSFFIQVGECDLIVKGHSLNSEGSI